MNVENIIEEIKQMLTKDTDLSNTSYKNIDDLLSDINKYQKGLNTNQTESIKFFKNCFYPTSIFQEIAINNGWENYYIILATKFDSWIMCR